ncbi:MAG: hypothetical protein L6461_02415 [Anaerolineae bacterium]|nr:hypothetical protein [Anaerolineae bacterium]
MEKYRILIETVAVTAIFLLGMLFIPSAKTLFALLPGGATRSRIGVAV